MTMAGKLFCNFLLNWRTVLGIGGGDGGSCCERELLLEAARLGRTFALARSNSCPLPAAATVDEQRSS